MACKILFTQGALADLELILDYIRADNPAAADRFGAALLDPRGNTEDFPKNWGAGEETLWSPQNTSLTCPHLLPLP